MKHHVIIVKYGERSITKEFILVGPCQDKPYSQVTAEKIRKLLKRKGYKVSVKAKEAISVKEMLDSISKLDSLKVAVAV